MDDKSKRSTNHDSKSHTNVLSDKSNQNYSNPFVMPPDEELFQGIDYFITFTVLSKVCLYLWNSCIISSNVLLIFMAYTSAI